MPKGRAAQIIARDLRKHKEARRKKIKVNPITHSNQNELLRMSTRKRLHQQHVNDNDLLFSELVDSESDLELDEDVTTTSYHYDELMKDKNFLLSMQPKMFAIESGESDGEEEFEA